MSRFVLERYYGGYGPLMLWRKSFLHQVRVTFLPEEFFVRQVLVCLIEKKTADEMEVTTQDVVDEITRIMGESQTVFNATPFWESLLVRMDADSTLLTSEYGENTSVVNGSMTRTYLDTFKWSVNLVIALLTRLYNDYGLPGIALIDGLPVTPISRWGWR